MKIYLRGLVREDALISYKWRNNPKVWKYTGTRPDIKITKEIELRWIENALMKMNEKRYAICVTDTNEYIGNVQLTNIEINRAEFHIFIGDTDYWGKGIGKRATEGILEIAFSNLSLNQIYLYVNTENIPAIKVYEKVGFRREKKTNKQYLMVIYKK